MTELRFAILFFAMFVTLQTSQCAEKAKATEDIKKQPTYSRKSNVSSKEENSKSEGGFAKTMDPQKIEELRRAIRASMTGHICSPYYCKKCSNSDSSSSSSYSDSKSRKSTSSSSSSESHSKSSKQQKIRMLNVKKLHDNLIEMAKALRGESIESKDINRFSCKPNCIACCQPDKLVPVYDLPKPQGYFHPTPLNINNPPQQIPYGHPAPLPPGRLYHVDPQYARNY
ncbi:uncharacterized protein LOC132203535 isoform X2 [Neocloeon triangulifer]|uniref:uncharacterized protein LOC132203535 isoform X2 n=1 Tax=Neocloeon triangulifer TaxID=2078957 RepID=UPI00286EE223|nr:uncharacterized protein LOC132203535 isoform X2 [Neocloeon triangulifer]